MAIVEDIGAARTASRVADALRRRQIARAKAFTPSSSTIETAGYGGHPGIVQANYAGIINNAIADYQNSADERKLVVADAASEDARRAALNSVLDSPTGLTARSMVDLADVGIDPAVLKMVAPEKPDRLDMNQRLQYGRDATGMRAINAIQPGTYTEEQIKQVDADARVAHEQDMRDKIQISAAGRAPREARAKTALEIALYGSEAEKAALAEYNKQIHPGGAGGRGGKAPLDPVAALQKNKDYATRLETMLNDKAAQDQLFSTSQQIITPAAAAAGGAENPGIIQAIAGQVAQANKSPMAAELDRMGAGASFETVKQLYPASNSDIKLALSMQPKVGDSEASMRRYLDQLKLINSKVESGAYGEPSQPAEERPAYYARMTPEDQQAWDEDHPQ